MRKQLTLRELKALIKEALDDNNLATSQLRKFPETVNTNSAYPSKARPLPVSLTPPQKEELETALRAIAAAAAATSKAAKTLELLPGGVKMVNVIRSLDELGIEVLAFLRDY